MEEMQNRQWGYYWVKLKDWHGNPSIGLWCEGEWGLVNSIKKYSDSDFIEINETRIPNPEEQLSGWDIKIAQHMGYHAIPNPRDLEVNWENSIININVGDVLTMPNGNKVECVGKM